jgi:hypothetical protein
MLNEQNTHSNIDAAIEAADFSDRPILKAVETALHEIPDVDYSTMPDYPH